MFLIHMLEAKEVFSLEFVAGRELSYSFRQEKAGARHAFVDAFMCRVHKHT